ncbi:hypothetical protein DKT77_06870 [Meridianimarinicoccus roseus]|uniref:Uncharacterized protein n=1 Tax=Meridianimarinicoccus roseus TaxID=2072018 RepID=A0A2V2LNU4_9RHOB|nr:DUF6522 family protein [Meridianimarinicoccus roseus]PWR03353.1 hypothetical protein DKT77_06870 [Meridianimarinicoccus roseus]
MRIDMRTGQPTIDATDLGGLLNLTPEEVRERLRVGRITTRLETGEGEDAGKMRLSFFHDDIRVRLTCSADGTVLKTLRTKAGQS